MISVKDRLPTIGEKVKCKVNLCRYGKVAFTEIVDSVFLGTNEIIGKPMFDIETYDEAYAEVVEWEHLTTAST